MSVRAGSDRAPCFNSWNETKRTSKDEEMKSEQTKTNESDQELTPLAGALVAGTSVPTEVLIVPWGRVESTNGDFTVDEESGRLAVEAFESHGCDLPIDYEHQTLGGAYTSPTGQAPAAGWIKRIEMRPDEGLVAEVRWTEAALAQVAAKQYRYLSPVAIVRKSDRKLVALHSVALTNKPAIVGMRPIVNRDTATDQGVTAAERLRHQLSLGADCGEDEVLLAASRRVVELESQIRLRRAEDRVAEAMAAGKLMPAQRNWATRLCLRDELLFDEWLATAAVVVPPGRLAPPSTSPGKAPSTSMAASARAEYRAHPELAALTSEEAFVADALRQQ